MHLHTRCYEKRSLQPREWVRRAGVESRSTSDIGPTDSARFKEGLPCRGVPALDGLAFTAASRARRPSVVAMGGKVIKCQSPLNVLK